MTQPPQQEYIITDEELRILAQLLGYNSQTLHSIRSRPYNPAPSPDPCTENGCTDVENCDEICKHSRVFSQAYVDEKVKAAREQVLDELDAIAKKGMKEKEDSLGEKYCREHPKQVDSCWHGLHRLVDSLRQQGGN